MVIFYDIANYSIVKTVFSKITYSISRNFPKFELFMKIDGR